MLFTKNIVAICLLLLLTVNFVRADANTHTGIINAIQQTQIIILDNKDGETEAFKITAETKITRDGKPAKTEDLQVGDRVRITAETENGKQIAKTIEARTPE